jgi:hypothetical protein
MTITKPTYRQLEGLNQSALKVYDSDPVKFYKEFILKEQREDTSSPAMLLGDLVDFYLLECRGNGADFDLKFDDKYVLFNGSRTTSQVFDLADELFKVTKFNMTEEGEIITEFETRFKEAFVNIQANGKYKGKTWEKALDDFNTNGMDYFQSLMKSIGKKVVDLGLVERAKAITEQLLTDDFTKNIFNDENLFTKHVIEFEWHGFKCKSELDAFSIDHENQSVQPYDLKVTYDNESFEYMYIKNSYYLQQAFYDKALEEYCLQNKIDHYTILPMQFIVADSSKNSRRPLVYKLTNGHTEQGYHGFTFNSRYYRGVNELMEAVTWSNFNQIWNCSKENFENNGVVELQEFK